MSNATYEESNGPPEVSLKVSAHDRVSSFILAMLYLVGFVVLLLFLVWLTTRATTARQQIEVEYLDELAGGDPSLGDGRDFEDPGIEDIQDLAMPTSEQLLTAVTDVASTTSANSDATAGDVSQGQGGGDRRRPGEGGNASVPRWERWQVRFTTTSLSKYAQQLDSFGIELAALGGRKDVDYVTDLTRPRPTVRSAKGSAEKRMYMSHRGGQLKDFDRQLLQRAGVSTSGRTLLQFYPRNIEAQLATLERRKAGGRPLKDIRRTVFNVRTAGAGYRFEVSEQLYH